MTKQARVRQSHLFGETPHEWDKDSWCTQPEVMDVVHRFWPDGIDLDPCSNAWAASLGFVRALVAWTKADDCMAQEVWPGRTCWLQPPYSDEGAPIVADWAKRWDAGQMHETLALIKLDTSTARYRALAERASSLVLFKKRLQHYEEGQRRPGSDFCSVMFLVTRENPIARHNALEEAVGDLGWVYR